MRWDTYKERLSSAVVILSVGSRLLTMFHVNISLTWYPDIIRIAKAKAIT